MARPSRARPPGVGLPPVRSEGVGAAEVAPVLAATRERSRELHGIGGTHDIHSEDRGCRPGDARRIDKECCTEDDPGERRLMSERHLHFASDRRAVIYWDEPTAAHALLVEHSQRLAGKCLEPGAVD